MKNNRLKGLLLSEWYTMKYMYIATVVMVVACIVSTMGMAAASGTANLGPSALAGGFGVILLSTAFAYDDWKGIGTYKRSMPYSDRDIVISRYIPPILIAAAQIILTPMGLFIAYLINGKCDEGFIGQAAYVTMINVLLCSAIVIIFYPLFFRFGYQKVQLMYGIIGALVMIGSLIVMMISMTVSEDGEDIADVQLAVSVPVCIAVIAVIVIAYYASYRLSLAGIKKKDN